MWPIKKTDHMPKDKPIEAADDLQKTFFPPVTGTFAEDVNFAAAVGMVFIILQFVGFVVFFSKSGATAVKRSSTLAVVGVASTLAAKNIELSDKEELGLTALHLLCKTHGDPLVQQTFLQVVDELT